MRHPSTTPETSYQLPPQAPKAVVSAHAAFTEVADRYVEAQGELVDLPTLANIAMSEARELAAKARVEGSAPPPKNKRPAEVRASFEDRIENARTLVESLAPEVDEAGNALALAIHEARAEWLDSLAPARQKLTASLHSQLAILRETLRQLGDLAGAEAWVGDFSLRDANLGQYGQFAGGSDLTFDLSENRRSIAFDSYVPATALIDILEQGLTPSESVRQITESAPAWKARS